MITKDGLSEDSDFDNARQQLLDQHKALLDSRDHIIYWGKVIELMIADGSMDKGVWMEKCSQYLEGKELNRATQSLK